MINRIDAYSGKTFSLHLRQPRQSLNLGFKKIRERVPSFSPKNMSRCLTLPDTRRRSLICSFYSTTGSTCLKAKISLNKVKSRLPSVFDFILNYEYG